MANSPLPCTLLTAVGCQELSSGNIYNLLSTLLYIKLATTSIRLLNGTNVTWQTFGLVSLSRCNIEVFHQRTHCSFSVCNPYSCYCHCDPTSAPHPVPIQFLSQVYGLLQTVFTPSSKWSQDLCWSISGMLVLEFGLFPALSVWLLLVSWPIASWCYCYGVYCSSVCVIADCDLLSVYRVA